MDLETARFLSSSEGRALLDSARAVRSLPLHRRRQALGTTAPPERVRAALLQDDLRARAGPRCPGAERLLFTPGALEQATAWPVAVERQARWPGPSDRPLCDLTASIGLDTLAALAGGRRVEAWERDPVRALLLAHNAEALGLGAGLTVHAEDARTGAPRGPLVFLDPDRRAGGRRTREAGRFEPPCGDWPALLGRCEAAMVKVAPVVPEGLLAGSTEEVVSLDGRVRERRLLLGPFSPRAPRRALALPGGQSVEGEGLPWPAARRPEPGLLLLDPDPAVTVAGLVGDLALRAALRPVHPRIAYLLGERPRADLPGRWLEILALLPCRAADIDRRLAAEGIGNLEIRTRGVADDAARWRSRLHPRGPRAGTLVLTRTADERWVALLARVVPMTTE